MTESRQAKFHGKMEIHGKVKTHDTPHVKVVNDVKVHGKVKIHDTPHVKVVNIPEVTTSISGDIVQISGQEVTTSISGDIVQISGQEISVFTISPSEVKTGSLLAPTDSSGGIQLSSGTISSTIVESLSANSGDIYIGGAINMPYSGYGIILKAGSTASLDIDNFNAVFVFSTVSVDLVSFGGT